MQNFIDKYVQILNSPEIENQDTVAPEIYFCMNSVKKFQEITKDSNLTEASLDTARFMESCSSIIMKNSQFMNPSRLLGVLQTFGDQQKEFMVKSILESMREDKYDIRTFNFQQLCEFIDHVADCTPQDLQVFKNYVDQAIT